MKNPEPNPEDEAFEELALKQGQWKYTSGWRKKQIVETDMKRDEVDIMWQQAMRESIKNNEMYTRYHFAKLVAEKTLADHAMREVQRLGQEIEQEKALQALHNENKRLGLYEDAYAEPVAWAMPQGWWIVESTPDNLKMWPTNEGELFVAGVTQPPQRTEQNFCPRCGKRTKDMTHIHTCTPPKD